MANPYRALPSVDRLLQDERLGEALRTRPRERVVAVARDVLAEAREAIGAGRTPGDAATLAVEVHARLDAEPRLPLRRAVNATGVVVHTNLGRAPLSPAALAAMAEIGAGYSNLEFDLEAGARGSRHEHVTGLVRQLTDAEDALVVNNNAAAVLLTLIALAAGREVVISRGELVEIGGGFRIPDVLRQSGATLVEVGTTNRTYTRDYEDATSERTAAWLWVHNSNYRVIGFTHAPALPELAAAAHARGVPLIADLGSGSLLDTSRYGLAREPLVQEVVAAGADLVCFSGDKLLGGPQAGIIVGYKALVGQLKRHPLTRAIRPDKATIAALGATLGHFVNGEAEREVPVWRMISARPTDIEARAARLIAALGPSGAGWEILDGASAIGGGSLPGETLPTRLLAAPSSLDPSALAAKLRTARPAVVGRIERGRLVLDLRTVLPHEDDALLAVLRNLPSPLDPSCVS
ncbi:MAG: L-seryl-tRNA(Sec) selenium transferase [Chloroflexi bacterium]|nr:L-seryl-tRNA(Sec) selenium transferase [Chloroflexota bacterium]